LDNYKEIIKEINSIAKENLKKNNSISPIAFVIKNNTILLPLLITFSNEEEKLDAYVYLGAFAKISEADTIIVANDVAMMAYSGIKEVRYSRKNYSTEDPLTYPERMRQDGIFFRVIDMKKRKVVNAAFQRYEKEEGKYKFDELDENYLKNKKIGGRLQESILKGYDLPVSKENFEKYVQKK